jgi:hypothetical protein
MVRTGLLVLALAGCGRVGFEIDGTGDAHAADAPRASCAFDLCDGFEAETLDSSKWTVDPMVTRDPSVAHRGSASARMHVDALAANGTAAAMLAESRTLATSRELWVRGWFRLSALPADGNELEVIGLAQTVADAAVHSVFVRADQVGFTLQSGISASTSIVLPAETWFCLVWHVRLSATDGALDLTGDLFEGPSATGGQTDTNPPIEVLRLGARFEPSQVTVNQPALDVWLDDVIVHSAPISCAD